MKCWLFAAQVACGAERGSLLRQGNTATRAQCLSLYDVEECFGRGWSAYGVHLLDTVRAQGIKAYTVLSLDQVYCEFGSQEDQLFARQEALEQGILRPFAKAHQNLVDFCAPAIIRNVVCDDIAGRLAAFLRAAPRVRLYFVAHSSLPDEERWILVNLSCQVLGEKPYLQLDHRR